NVPIPGNNKFFKGGNVRINGNISHSSTVKTANDITEQGSTTTVSGNLGANYTFDIPIYGDLTVGAYTSAFKMKDAGETQVAGGVHGPFGLEKTVGITPGYSGWSGLSIGHAVQAYPFIALDLVRGEEEVAMKKINEAPVIITATGVYNDSNFFGKNKNVTTERYVGAELNAYIKSNNSNVTITYGSQISGDIKDRAVNSSYAQTFKGGNNLEFKVAGEAGYGWGNTIETDPHASNKGFRLGISGSISFAK
ncbi:MAG: hypothetical protein II085_04200, partial [Alphaproteobacteria bacterium]|nr:hypothetical protein [Alphaproteobacteria bacterium]